MYIDNGDSDNSSLAILNPLPLTYHENSNKLLGWNLPAEHMHLVHPHWRGFPAPPYYLHLMLAMIYFALMFASFIGNGIVIWIFSTSKSLRTASNMFIINLAIFDIVMGLEMPMFLANSFAERLIGFETGCIIYAALGSISGIGASITNAMIAFDRYKTISSPLDGRLTKPQAGILVAIAWVYALPFTLLPTLKVWGRFVPEGFLTTCSFDYLTDDQDTRVFVMVIAVWSYAIPMFLISSFYFKLFGRVRAHEKMLRDQARKMNVKSLVSNQDRQQSVEIRIAKTAFTIFFLFVCAWTPYGIVALIGAFGDRNTLTPLATMIPAVCCKIVSCIDPWIYAISHPRYRQELEKRLPWMGIREACDDNSSSGDNKSMVSVSTTVQPTTPGSEQQ